MSKEGVTRKKKPWWLLSVIGVYLLTSWKYIVALLKFGKFGGAIISFAVTVGAYALVFKVWFAVGLVVMILIHELGHVLAAKRKGLPVTAPVFIPFLGALIMMKKHPRDAVTEAYIAIGGPVLGTVGALVSLWIGLHWQIPLLIVIANVGFFINLINLLPIHPLDGGRISTAVTRWLWLVGLIGGLVVIYYLQSILFFIIWAMFAWEMVQKFIILRGKGKKQQADYRFEIPVEHFMMNGLMIPGEEHRKELPIKTYSSLDGKQYVEVEWDGIGFRQSIGLPQQGIVKRVYVSGIEHRPKRSVDSIVIRLTIDYQAYESDKYYEVPTSVRAKFGLAYGGIAIFLIYMMYFVHTQNIPLPDYR
jgi:Zn-dependent protease